MATLIDNAPGLYVPEPGARPGETPDFSKIAFDAAGAVDKPELDTPASDMRGHAYRLIRVMDEQGVAQGPWNPRLSTDVLLRGLSAMMLTRAYDARMVRAQRQGKTSFYMKCTGEEAVAVAAALALERGDMCFPTYRQQGLLLGRDWPVTDLMNQVYSNRGDRLKGRQMPVFYSSKEAGFFSISGNLGTQLIQAVGWAMACAYSHDHHIAAAWTGDGATAEGDFHYAMTFASVYRAPVIMNIVNNQWAISSFSGIAGEEQTTFAARGVGYGIPAIRVDGNDFLAVYAATQWAAERARQHLGPTVIEHYTYRAEGHSTSDDPSKYRPKDAGRDWPLGDPIARLRDHLIALGAWDATRHAALAGELEAEVLAANKVSEKLGTLTDTPRTDPESMFDDVFKDMPWHLVEQRKQAGF